MFRFEQLNVYQKAVEYYKVLIPLSNSKMSHDCLANQIRKSSSSVVLNIAEGSGKVTSRDKQKYYRIAVGSLNESVATAQLFMIEGKITKHEFERIKSNADIIARMLNCLIQNPNGKY